MFDARFSHLYFCQSLYTLQRGLPAIAGLLVRVAVVMCKIAKKCNSLPSTYRWWFPFLENSRFYRRLDDINVQACTCGSLCRTITKFSVLLFYSDGLYTTVKLSAVLSISVVTMWPFGAWPPVPFNYALWSMHVVSIGSNSDNIQVRGDA